MLVSTLEVSHASEHVGNLHQKPNRIGPRGSTTLRGTRAYMYVVGIVILIYVYSSISRCYVVPDSSQLAQYMASPM